MKQLIKDAVAGCGYMPGYGDHPGTVPVIFFVLAFVSAGAIEHGLLGALGGFGVALVTVVPLYLAGAIGRAREYRAEQSRKNG